MAQPEPDQTDTLPQRAYVPPLPDPAWRHDPLMLNPGSALTPKEFWECLGL